MLKKPGRLSRRMLSQVSAAASAPLLLQFPPPPAVRSTSLSLYLSISLCVVSGSQGEWGGSGETRWQLLGFHRHSSMNQQQRKLQVSRTTVNTPCLFLLGGLALISRKSVALILLVGFRVLLPDSVRPAP